MPARLTDIKRALQAFGVELSRPSSGSHWKLKKPGFRPFPIPAGNGERTEISDRYIAALCTHFGIDRQAFLASL